MSDHVINAAKAVLHAWDAENHYEKNGLSDDLFHAMDDLRMAVRVIREVVPNGEEDRPHHSFTGS
jgi:hypothetical protein